MSHSGYEPILGARRWAALIATGVAAAALLPRSSARACGETPEPLVTISQTLPYNGETDVPIDAALAIRFGDWSSGEPVFPAVPRPDSVSVKVATGDGIALSGTVSEFGQQLVWRPASPMQPNTQHVMEVVILDPRPLPRAAPPRRDAIIRFVTGSRRLAPLEVESSEIVFELYDATVAECASGTRLTGLAADQALGPPAGCPLGHEACKKIGQQRLPHVRTELELIRGGQDELGYTMLAYLTAGEPYRFDTAEQQAVVSWVGLPVTIGTQYTVAIDVPPAETDYTACIAVQIRDASGAVFELDPVCDDGGGRSMAPAPQPIAGASAPLVRPNGQSGAGVAGQGAAAGSTGTTGRSGREPAMFRTACAIAAPGSASGGQLLWLAALLALRVARKRSHGRVRGRPA